MSIKWLRILFVLSGIYDGVLGLAFLLWPNCLFEYFDVPPANHMGYVQFPALLLIVFACLFFRVAMDPVKNRELILYGCGLKLAYCGTVFWHSAFGFMPPVWVFFAWADLVFLALFIAAWRRLHRQVSAAK